MFIAVCSAVWTPDLFEWKESGIHGALVILDPTFNADVMATAMGIPTSKNIIRRHLATELESLVQITRYNSSAKFTF
jgi:hypothetical protein